MESDLEALVLCHQHENRIENQECFYSSPSSDFSPTTIVNFTYTKSVKICDICGDRARSYYFGALCCEACRTFFRRALHNNAYATFTCKFDQSCQIQKNLRKYCQRCRFQKCMDFGMLKNWTERKEEIARHKIRVQTQMSGGEMTDQGNPPPFSPGSLEILGLSDFLFETQNLCEYHRCARMKLPYNLSQGLVANGVLDIVKIFVISVKRFAQFSLMIPEFQNLPKDDQRSLLKSSVFEMIALWGSLNYDEENNCWRKKEDAKVWQDSPTVREEDARQFATPFLLERQKKFTKSICQLKVDEHTLMILMMIAMFSPERVNHDNYANVAAARNKFQTLLRKYVDWKWYGSGGASDNVFSGLLAQLTDLRELSALHTRYAWKIGGQEAQAAKELISDLELSLDE